MRALRNTMRNKHVRGLVVGYPLDENGKPTVHCHFIEKFLETLTAHKVISGVPVTLVNERGSSMAAKVQIANRVQLIAQNHA